MSRPAPYAIRSILIAYGTAAFGYWLSRDQETGELGGIASPGTLFFVGVAIQVALIAFHALIKRYATDPDVAAQARDLIELMGDAATVLLFALATLGPLFVFDA